MSEQFTKESLRQAIANAKANEIKKPQEWFPILNTAMLEQLKEWQKEGI